MKTNNKIIDMAEKIFGTMREATKEEKKGIYDYIKSISHKTGTSFYDEIGDKEKYE